MAMVGPHRSPPTTSAPASMPLPSPTGRGPGWRPPGLPRAERRVPVVQGVVLVRPVAPAQPVLPERLQEGILPVARVDVGVAPGVRGLGREVLWHEEGKVALLGK